DGPGHGNRHAADVAGPGRGRRIERPAGAGGDRGAAPGDGNHAILRAGDVQRAATEGAAGPGPGAGGSVSAPSELPGARRQQHAEHDDLGFALPAPVRVGRARAGAIVIIVLMVIAAAFVVGYLPRRQARTALEEGARRTEDAPARVSVVKPKIAAS